MLAFDARVVGVHELAGRPAVVLDRTAFYPEGGGQPADRGLLSGVPVLDVQDVNGEVLHALGGSAPGEGREVRGEVDGARRRDHVQQHHGQHLLSAAFEAVKGAHTVSFHLGEEICTIDLDQPLAALGPGVLRDAEALANDLVWRDLPVSARDRTPEELQALPMRKESAKGSRVVVVGEPGAVADATPCGGTHPRRTGEVGAVAVLRAVKWASGTRVEFACGHRVVAMLTAAGERLGSVAQALRCAPAEVAAAAARAAEDAASRRKDVERLLAVAAEAEAARLAGRQDGPAVKAVLSPPVPGAAAWLKAVGQALAGRGRVALLGAVEEGRAHLGFTRPRGEGPHLGQALQAAVSLLGGKGGGAPDAAQGSGPAIGMLEAALGEAARRVSAGA